MYVEKMATLLLLIIGFLSLLLLRETVKKNVITLLPTCLVPVTSIVKSVLPPRPWKLHLSLGSGFMSQFDVNRIRISLVYCFSKKFWPILYRTSWTDIRVILDVPFTVYQRSLDPFFEVTFLIKWIRTSWTYSTLDHMKQTKIPHPFYTFCPWSRPPHASP